MKPDGFPAGPVTPVTDKRQAKCEYNARELVW
jgi:hypothetical protein